MLPAVIEEFPFMQGFNVEGLGEVLQLFPSFIKTNAEVIKQKITARL